MEDNRVVRTRTKHRTDRQSARRNCVTFPHTESQNQSGNSNTLKVCEEAEMADTKNNTSALDDPDAKDVMYRPNSGSNRNSKMRLSRMNTCSIDLSDVSVHPKHSEDLHAIEDPHSQRISRTASFTSGDLPKLFRFEEFDECEVLGAGAFGRAVKMRHKRFQRFYVIKELLEHRKASEENLLQEISVLKNLNHPNVLKCVGVVLRDKCMGIVTEFIEGGSLFALIHSSTNLTWARRIHFARDIANGMLYLHRKSIIHRDLNSHNCFVRDNESVVVADFGLAKIVLDHCSTIKETLPGHKSHTNLRRKHTVVGNPYWMAPEMLAHGTYGLSADVYSFGLILCELIAGLETDPNFLPRRLETLSLDIKSYLKLVPIDCPPALLEVNIACSQFNPDERPDFSSCLSWLEQLCLHVEDGSPPPKGSLTNSNHCLS